MRADTLISIIAIAFLSFAYHDKSEKLKEAVTYKAKYEVTLLEYQELNATIAEGLCLPRLELK